MTYIAVCIGEMDENLLVDNINLEFEFNNFDVYRGG